MNANEEQLRFEALRLACEFAANNAKDDPEEVVGIAQSFADFLLGNPEE